MFQQNRCWPKKIFFNIWAKGIIPQQTEQGNNSMWFKKKSPCAKAGQSCLHKAIAKWHLLKLTEICSGPKRVMPGQIHLRVVYSIKRSTCPKSFQDLPRPSKRNVTCGVCWALIYQEWSDVNRNFNDHILITRGD